MPPPAPTAASSSSPPPAAVPVLTDGVVRLRAHHLADVDAIVEQCRDPEMVRFTRVPEGYSRQDGVRRVEQMLQGWQDPNGTRAWLIDRVDDDAGAPRYAGMIALRRGESPRTASLAFSLHPAARGQGLMSRAVRLAATYAFEQQPWGAAVTRVHWRAVVGNWASRRVAWATGFAFHGTLPESHADPRDAGAAAVDVWVASLGLDDPMAPKAPWFEPPVLEQDGIRLRPWRDSDVEDIEPRDDPENWMPTGSVLRRETFAAWLHRRRELMASGSAVEWCVADAASDRMLGAVVVFDRSGTLTGDVAELGYQFNPSGRGRGAARTAARLAIRHALQPLAEGGLGLRRLVASTAADNHGSNRVLTSNGFVEIGREHQVDPLPDGSFADALHWELLPPVG